MRRLQVILPDAMVLALMERSQAVDVPLVELVQAAVEAYLAATGEAQSGERDRNGLQSAASLGD